MDVTREPNGSRSAAKLKRRGVKRGRLAARISEEQKVLLQRAADPQGRSLSDFVLESAQRAAEAVIREREVITLHVCLCCACAARRAWPASTRSARSRSSPRTCHPRLPNGCPATPRSQRCLFVGRLAVDQRYQGQGAGRALLMSALGRSLEIRVRVDAIGVIVDAKMIERERSMSSTVSSASNLTHNALSS